MKMPAKEILLYGDVYSYSAANIVSQMNEAKNSDVTLRFNGDGGEVRMAWGIIAKSKELKGKKTFKNDGEANSIYALAFCYNDNNEAIDTATFLFHRAAWPESYEKSEFFTEHDRVFLVECNSKLRAALEAKVDVPMFERFIDCTLNQLFSLDGRVERRITADQALKCKLVERVVKITPEYKNEITALAAQYSRVPLAARNDPPPPTSIPTNMTIDEIKSKFPETYRAIFAKGKAKGIEMEFDRTGSILAHMDADQKGALEAWKSGKPLTETQKSEFAIKAVSKNAAAALTAENAEPVVTGSTATTAAEKLDPAKKAIEDKSKLDFNKGMDDAFKTMYPNSKKVA